MRIRLCEEDARFLADSWPLPDGQRSDEREDRALERQLRTLELPERDVERWLKEADRDLHLLGF